MTKPRLLYDADCGFCTRSAHWLARRGLSVLIEPMQSVDLAALGVDPGRAEGEIPLVTGHRVRYGAEAIGLALATGRPPWRVLGRLLAHPTVLWIARPAYALVTRYRHRLPGATPSCRLP